MHWLHSQVLAAVAVQATLNLQQTRPQLADLLKHSPEFDAQTLDKRQTPQLTQPRFLTNQTRRKFRCRQITTARN